ncbi:phosphotransferase [Candidatus Poribacteria bacterium]|jgi:Ser/Thr protein kinase RdoA (MazF antagonist)|nr:phosphotransferase [Candidatus Poribacteria bacterium]MBT5533256.1 phosphotransferase [Candidatus Poribacteria bacterium]MBT5710178.1 phosphotransferase [Candidatus Poribacteria bacterium]MBT7096453.1 phosphotransferase [Candidatus Poribacteria bacterium]MBT7807605.1 phosphotransferase [Candidatus Poribacteria bacterium]
MNAHGPDLAWLAQAFGVRPSGALERIGGKLASVFRFTDEATGREFVARVSDASHIPPARLARVHAFLAYIDANGVRTPVPLSARSGLSHALDPVSGRIVEVYPYISGRHPARGPVEDATRVARALAAFHTVGLQYANLPGEEACDQNHVALGRLEADLRRARTAARGKPYESLFAEYVADADRVIAAIRRLRPRLVETCLHLDANPDNIIFGDDGDVHFIDCSHTARGRRVFDVVTAAWYLDPASAAEGGDPRRYAVPDAELADAFMASYRAHCAPAWQDAESEAHGLERHLMLVHGAVYWALECPDEQAMRELTGFLPQVREHHG